MKQPLTISFQHSAQFLDVLGVLRVDVVVVVVVVAVVAGLVDVVNIFCVVDLEVAVAVV